MKRPKYTVVIDRLNFDKLIIIDSDWDNCFE